MKKTLFSAALGLLTVSSKHAQGTVEWSAPIEGDATSIFFNQFTQTPVLEKSKAYVGIDNESQKVAWTVKKSAKNEALKKLSTANAVTGQDKDEAGAFVEEDYKEIPFTQYAFIGNYILDVYDGNVVLGNDATPIKSLESNDVIPELNCVLFKIKNENNDIILYSVDIASDKILWNVKVGEASKGKDVIKFAAKMNGNKLPEPVDNFVPGVDSKNNIIYKNGKKLFQIDSKTGKINWENECNPSIFFTDPTGKYILCVEKASSLMSGAVAYGKKMVCIDATTGKSVWGEPMKLDASYVDHMFLNDNEMIISQMNGINRYDIKAGKNVWEKGFSSAFTTDYELEGDNIKVYYGNKIMLVNAATGEKVWKKAIEMEDIDETATAKIEKRYSKSWAMVTPNKIAVYNNETNKKKWSIYIDKEDKVAFDDKNGKILVISGKKIYVLDPDNDEKKPDAIDAKIDSPKEIAGFKVSENGYFIFGQKEFIMVSPDKTIVDKKVYSQLKSGRLTNALLSTALVASAAMSTTVSFEYGNGNTVAESGLFCDVETARQAGRAYEGQLKMKRQLKENNKMRKAVRSNNDFAIFLSGEKANGQDNLSLVIVNKNTGKEVKTDPFSNNRKVVYEIDFNNYKVYFVENNKLVSMKL